MIDKLVERVRVTQDQAAFMQLVKLTQTPVRNYLKRLCNGDDGLAEELAQDTFFAAFKYIDSYKGDERFISWLLAIAHQKLVRHHRGYKPTLTDLDQVSEVTLELHHHIDDDIEFAQIVAKLPPQQRALVELHFEAGFSHQEMGQLLEQPEGTIKSQLYRAIKTLKQPLSRGVLMRKRYE